MHTNSRGFPSDKPMTPTDRGKSLVELIKIERKTADLDGYYEGSMGTRADYENAKAATDAAIANLAVGLYPAPQPIDREALAKALFDALADPEIVGYWEDQTFETRGVYLQQADAVIVHLSTQPITCSIKEPRVEFDFLEYPDGTITNARTGKVIEQ
jgi:hypothetical protein